MAVGLLKVCKVDLGLKGKKILVTGSSQGIGAAIAAGFLEEGADVFLVSRGIEKLSVLENQLKMRYGEDRIVSAICDCTSAESLQNLKELINEKWGKLDSVIANVGDGRSVPDVIPNDEQWVKTWNSNFESVLQTSRVFLPMLEKSKGSLLLISSITALEAFGAPVDYSTAKTAVVAFAKNIARKIAKDVRVNVLAPGNVNFPGGSWDKKIKTDRARVEKLIENTVPMNRFGTPEEIADAAIFLCSKRASFITGSVLVVDGGQTVSVV